MLRTFPRQVTLLLMLSLLAFPAPAQAQKKGGNKAHKKFQKPVKMLIGAIRYGKYDLALKLLDLDQMTRRLNAGHWAKMNAAQRAEFSKHLGTLLKKLSFVKARGLFKHIDAVLYDAPKLGAKQVSIRSTIVVHRAYKKKELVITWFMLKHKRGYRIVDVKTVGESTVAGLREEQIDPLVKEGGVALLLKKMRAKVAEVSK